MVVRLRRLSVCVAMLSATAVFAHPKGRWAFPAPYRGACLSLLEKLDPETGTNVRNFRSAFRKLNQIVRITFVHSLMPTEDSDAQIQTLRQDLIGFGIRIDELVLIPRGPKRQPAARIAAVGSSAGLLSWFSRHLTSHVQILHLQSHDFQFIAARTETEETLLEVLQQPSRAVRARAMVSASNRISSHEGWSWFLSSHGPTILRVEFGRNRASLFGTDMSDPRGIHGAEFELAGTIGQIATALSELKAFNSNIAPTQVTLLMLEVR